MRRERFVEELESYSKQLEEFQTFGDMQEIQRYLKKAQALNQRLESAAEKVGLSIFVILKESFLPQFNKNKALDRILELDSYSEPFFEILKMKFLQFLWVWMSFSIFIFSLLVHHSWIVINVYQIQIDCSWWEVNIMI